jgi:uncharacterized protein (DUF1330 family)
MPVAHLMVEMKVTDPQKFKGYMAQAPAAVKALVGEYLAREGATEYFNMVLTEGLEAPI